MLEKLAPNAPWLGEVGGLEINLLKDLKGVEEFPPILPNCC
jgi:hypothetical protein